MILFNRLNNSLLKTHVIITVLGLFFGLLLYNYFSASLNLEEKTYNTIGLILSGIGGVLLAYFTYFISDKLDTLIPWKDQLVNRFISGIIVLFITSYAFISISVFSYAELSNQAVFKVALDNNNLIKLGIILFIVMLFYTIIYFALYSYYTYSKLQIEEVKFKREQYELQLKALKSQLSSHFLFNNLNTISSLAFKDAKQAEIYIRGLAKIYSYTLNSYQERLVTIQEELEVVKAYLSLLSTRFGAVLTYSIDISEVNLKHKIPPLTLQMLVENVVKHNQASETNPLNISIFEEHENLVIKNNITKNPIKLNSYNIGLNNIDSRYQLLYNKGISILEDTNYTVKIPIIIIDE
jgi:two-component system LytT family sensor kinase